MIDPWVELGGWIIAQAIEDVCSRNDVLPEDVDSAWNFLKQNPLVDEILDHIDHNIPMEDKREYILTVVIPQKVKEYQEKTKLASKSKLL